MSSRSPTRKSRNESTSSPEGTYSPPTSYAGGESGPRRSTILPTSSSTPSSPRPQTSPTQPPLLGSDEPMDTAAANAEAYRLAHELGVTSSSRRQSRGSSRSWSNLLNRGGGSSANNNRSATPNQDLPAEASSNYVRMRDMKDDSYHSQASSEAAHSRRSATPYHPFDMDSCPSYHSSSRNNANNINNNLQPPSAETGTRRSSSVVSNNSVNSVTSRGQLSEYQEDPKLQNHTDQEIHVYDSHGQRAPYKEGPYFIAREKDGRVIKKRWYGRLEDGYLAWSSIFLHEYFNFTIYTPLTPEEELELKKPDGNIPRWMCEFTSLPNLAIPMSYFCIGVALQLLRTPLIVYFISDLNATAAEVNVLFTVMAVPWCFKVIYGFLSDCLPISGQRRKPYFMTGWLVYIVANFLLTVNPVPSIQLCILLVFLQTAGYMLADVMTDALIVERSRYESQETRGTMQSIGYIIRFFGSTIGAFIGAVVYNKQNWEWYLPIRVVFFINGAFPVVFLMPFVPYLLELDTNCHPKNFYQQCRELFATAQLRAVWQPMTFVYIYNALQLTNAAWMNFLIDGLDFSAWQIGLVSIVGSIMAWFGIMTYKRFFFASNWRIVYFWCTTLASLIALGQLILVFGVNRSWGIGDIWFSMGDDVLVEFVIAVQFLPMCIMYLGLCPPGSEGTTYAMLTTWSNLAGSLAFDISTALTVVWDVSTETIKAGDYSGIWKLSLLCGLIGPVPLILLGLIPRNKEDQRKLQQDTSRHYWAGVAFITVMILTLLVTFVESVYEVYFNDESDDYSEQRRRLSRLLIGH